MSRFIFIVFFTCWAASAALAADKPADEIVYRASLGRASDVELLLKKGAPADGKNEQGVPILALAAAREDAEGLNVVKALLTAGAPIEERDAQGQTALFYAVRQGNLKMVQYLLSQNADYYALDNTGNSARNLAYSSGHADIGAAIDNYVKNLGVERAKQYEAFNKAMTERLKPQEQAKTPAPPPDTAPAAAVLSEEEQAAQMAAAKKRDDDTKHAFSDLAFNNCAFQYWSFISESGQSTPLSQDDLDSTIEAYKGKIETLEDTLTKSYKQQSGAVAKVSRSAKQRLVNILTAMPSKNYRHEEGVGKEDDMQSRCKSIARRWDEEPAAAPAPPPTTTVKGQNRRL